MRFETIGEDIIEADDLYGIAVALSRLQFEPSASLQEWMEGSAERAYMWNKSVVSTESAEQHILDLVSAGLIKRLD
jgi:hypothetical protein